MLGPKYYNVNGIWALKPYYLGPWTLRGGSQQKALEIAIECPGAAAIFLAACGVDKMRVGVGVGDHWCGAQNQAGDQVQAFAIKR